MASELVSPVAALAAVAPVTRRVRAYYAPVNRAAAQPRVWDPGTIASFCTDAPPAPWLDLGWCTQFVRKSDTNVQPLITGAPGTVVSQVRTEVAASVALAFETWGKLQLALTGGAQQMNVLALAPGSAANGSGGYAISAVPVNPGSSSATSVDVGSAVDQFAAGAVIAVDVDYTGQTGFVGSGVSGGYVKSAALIGSDPDYVRRVTLNVARITAIDGTVLELGSPLGGSLIAGAPVAGMQVSQVAAFCDREGGSFFHEWSALFVLDGAEGDRLCIHYPRLQAYTGAAETSESLPGTTSALTRHRLAGSFRALPVKDSNDGEQIVCFRSYLPGALRAV